MLFLLDTNAFSDLMNRHPKLDSRMANLTASDRVVICSVVRGEIQEELNGWHRAGGDRN